MQLRKENSNFQREINLEIERDNITGKLIKQELRAHKSMKSQFSDLKTF